MRVTPKSEQQINEENLIPHKTVCDFEVVESKNATSKSGNEMIALKLKVFYGDGYKLINDYLLDAMAAKLRHFVDETGLTKRYEAGALDATDCLGRCGKCKVKLEPSKDDYPAKNSILDYGVKEKGKAAEAPAADASTPPEDDDVPF